MQTWPLDRVYRADQHDTREVRESVIATCPTSVRGRDQPRSLQVCREAARPGRDPNTGGLENVSAGLSYCLPGSLLIPLVEIHRTGTCRGYVQMIAPIGRIEASLLDTDVLGKTDHDHSAHSVGA